MLQIIFLLVIVPTLLGYFTKEALQIKTSGLRGFYFVLGFLIMVAEFAVVCYPAICFDTPFHIVYCIILIIYVAESLGILFWLIMRRKPISKKVNIKETFLPYLRSPAFWFMVAICGFQIIRLVVSEPYQIRDSKTYNAFVTDILQTDHLFRTFQTSGFPFPSVLYMKIKFTLSTWYPFQSMLAGISKIHPLIICNTIMPGYILLMDYVVLYSLGSLLFKRDKCYACFFTAICAFIHEVTLYCHTPTMINLVWPVWGKGVVSCTIIPVLLILFIQYNDEMTNIRSFVLFFIIALIGIAGCSMSPMSGIVIPLELGILGLTQAIKQRKAQPLVFSIISCCPCFLYLGVYYYLSQLQQLLG